VITRLRALVLGLILAVMTVAGTVVAAVPAGANTYIKEVLLQDMPGVVPGGEIHYKFLETAAAEIYVFMYGSDFRSHIDIYVCRSGDSSIDGADHAYGEVDNSDGHGGWAGVAWGDEYNVGKCKLYQSLNMQGDGTPTLMRFIVADNYHTTTKQIKTATVNW